MSRLDSAPPHLSPVRVAEAASAVPMPAAVRAHLETCDACQRRVAADRDDRARFFAMAPHCRAAQQAPTRPARRPLGFALGTVGALALVALWVRPAGAPAPAPGARVKGARAPIVRVARDGDWRPLSKTQPLQEGDRLALAVRAADPTYAWWWHQTADGDWTSLVPHPETDDPGHQHTGWPAHPGTEAQAAHVFTLDAAPAPGERLVLITSPGPLPAAAARAALPTGNNARAPASDASLQVFVISLGRPPPETAPSGSASEAEPVR